MLTPQEVSEKKFPKAIFGGYDMSEVDDFLDQLAADYEKLFKESTIIKSKLKILADKVEEYRSVDDDMRRTYAEAKRGVDGLLESGRAEAESLLSGARAEAETILSSARSSADELTTGARAEAERRILELKHLADAEAERLTGARRAMSNYISEASLMCRRQLELLSSIASEEVKSRPRSASVSVPGPTAAPAPEDTAATTVIPDAADASGDTAATTVIPDIGGVVVPDEPEHDDSPTIFFEPASAASAKAAVTAVGGDEPRITERRETPLFSDEPQPDSDFFRHQREVNIGGRNIKVFDVEEESNAFRDIFKDD